MKANLSSKIERERWRESVKNVYWTTGTDLLVRIEKVAGSIPVGSTILGPQRGGGTNSSALRQRA